MVKSVLERIGFCKPTRQQAALMQMCSSMHVPVQSVKDEDAQAQEHTLSSVPSQFLTQISPVSTLMGVYPGQAQMLCLSMKAHREKQGR